MWRKQGCRWKLEKTLNGCCYSRGQEWNFKLQLLTWFLKENVIYHKIFIYNYVHIHVAHGNKFTSPITISSTCPQILLILALQNTDMLKLLRFELIEPQRRMKEVKHAIVQCYAKESLLYNFTMSDVKKRSGVSIKLKCYDKLSWVATYSIML